MTDLPDNILAFRKDMYDETLGSLPSYQTARSAGMDIKACLPEGPIVLKAGQRALIPTSLFPIFLRDDIELQIRPRSGLAYRNGITVLNSPGTVDNDYTGEIKVILYNTSSEDFEITHGMRIAQAVAAQFMQVSTRLTNVTSASSTSTRQGGFGSTGLS